MNIPQLERITSPSGYTMSYGPRDYKTVSFSSSETPNYSNIGVHIARATLCGMESEAAVRSVETILRVPVSSFLNSSVTALERFPTKTDRASGIYLFINSRIGALNLCVEHMREAGDLVTIRVFAPLVGMAITLWWNRFI